MDTIENIAKKLRKYRLDRQQSQEVFADEVGVTRNTISNIENAVGFPNIQSIEKICKHLNITYEEFLEPTETHSDLYNIVNAKIKKLDKEKIKLVNKFIDTITTNWYQ